ncbi:MAG TPA: class I SAM-dependent methyltransferase [Blastocatellia bacterium]|nr:class I SAM-dependent methyltransferase [Blastocatellia bacterium]
MNAVPSAMPDVEARAQASGGESTDRALYESVRRCVMNHHLRGEAVIDVGCGQGALWRYLNRRFDRYVGVDVIQYERFPQDARANFHRIDLESGRIDLPDASADLVCCLETIEHVENPRSLMREVVRLVKPGGAIVITTPNQLNVLSKLCLILKNEFVFFQERPGMYPAHLSALLEIDLIRLARENALAEVEIAYTGSGRIPATARHWPRWLTAAEGWRGRAFSDNILLFGRKPGSLVMLGDRV